MKKLLLAVVLGIGFSAAGLSVGDLVERIDKRSKSLLSSNTRLINKILEDMPTFDMTDVRLMDKWEDFDKSFLNPDCCEGKRWSLMYYLGRKGGIKRCTSDIKKSISRASSFVDYFTPQGTLTLSKVFDYLEKKERNYYKGLAISYRNGELSGSFYRGIKKGYQDCMEKTEKDVIKNSLNGFYKKED